MPPRHHPREDSPTTLRIIGGHFRGRTLVYSGDPQTRPMKDRVRENLFNLLTTEVIGKHAIDLFAGTGALGFEALSRQALFATLIERHIPTSKIIRENAERLDVRDRVEIISVDAFAWVKRLTQPQPAFVALGKSQAPPKSVAPWLVFLSPPWTFFQERKADLLSMIQTLIELSPPESILVVEADDQFDLGQLPSAEAWDVRPYLPAVLAIYRREG